MLGVDAGFLYLETPTLHMHTLKIAIVEPPDDLDLARLGTELAARLHQLPPLSRRAVPVPFGLNHPMWVHENNVDLTQHLFTDSLPTPAGMSELAVAIGDVASTGLDRSRPLWEMHLYPLADGRHAVVAKLHHALADGGAANALLANVTDQLGDTTPAPRVAVEHVPSRVALISRGLIDAVRQLAALPPLLVRTVLAIAALVRHKRTSKVRTPLPILDVPRTSFNAPLTARRSYATCTVSLDEIKAVRKRYDVTVNDVVLAMVAGALRSWLDERGERPSKSLVAGVPVGTDDAGGPPRLGGNRVSNLFTTLATDIDDPVERLRTISRVTSEAKTVQRILGPTMLADWVQFTPPGAFSLAMRSYSRLRVARLHPAPFNVIVSSVAGPREPVTIGGAPLHDLFSVGPLMEGIGLNVTAWSYVGRMNFSLLACPDLLADVAGLAARFGLALTQLSS
jgi:diacylglycerol O-acyltransferase